MRAAHAPPPAGWRPHAPDEALLRRFGYVRAVGGVVWTGVVALLVARFGTAALPLLLGVPVLVIVTAVYFARSLRYPRTMVMLSLVADAIVLASAIAFFGGTGSGLVMLYAIVVVSAGLLLGPSSAVAFTLLGLLLAAGQLGLEQMGLPPRVLHRPDLADRVRVLLASGAGLVSVGYLSAIYASRLHELIADAGLEAARVRARGRRRRRYVAQVGRQVQRRLAELESLTAELEAPADDGERRAEVAARIRIGVDELDAAVSELADAAALDRAGEVRPQPIRLGPVVDDCLRALASRLESHVVTVDIEPLRVVGDRRTARRIVFNLLENVADHTPAGTSVHVAARAGAGQAVLAVTDDGPGIAAARVPDLFEPSPNEEGASVGLPLVRELCEVMGAQVRYEPARGGGSRFLVVFRLAPSGAPEGEEALEDAAPGPGVEPGGEGTRG